MKIAWFTPLARRSAIGEFSIHVAEALSVEHDVELWTAHRSDVALQSSALPVVNVMKTPESLTRLPLYDATVYNVGDHREYHLAILRVAHEHPGVVILHDLVLQSLFVDWIVVTERDPEAYVRLLAGHYGAAVGRRVAEAIGGLTAGISHDEVMLRYPLFEEAITGALGVVVHSAWQEARVRERWRGPLQRLFLPTYSSDWQPIEPVAPMEPIHDAFPSRTTVLTIGNVIHNKRIHRVVDVLSRRPDLAQRVHYVVIGSLDAQPDYVQKLRAFIDARGLQTVVSLLGWQRPQALSGWLRRAEIHVNLRWPAGEGGSASLMRQLTTGRPVIVADTGVYAELPQGAAVKVRPDDDDALEAALEQLVEDPERRRTIGSEALRYARPLTPERYALELAKFLERELPRGWLLSLCDRVGGALREMGVDTSLQAVDGIAAELAALAGDQA